MTLRSLSAALFATALAGALIAPAAAEQVFQNVSTGRLAPLPTPAGVPVYDGYFYPCYWGNGSGRGHGHDRGNSGTGTINGERFYPYDPRSHGVGGGNNGWNCYSGQPGGGHHPRPRPRPSMRPYPPRIPLSSPKPRS